MPAETTREHISAEAPDVAARSVLAYIFGFLACVMIAMAGLYAFYLRTVTGPLIATPRVFPEPRLQSNPQGDLHRLQAEQRKALSTYTWADPARGVVQIPIERAMQVIVARGEHALDPLQGQAATPAPGASGGAVK
jgi:hypothetical protein